ncbi:hypothetical protein VNO77_11841 [Canavalia gladiata]|uniref:Uncharacterized protein n=1 Tax=Canavalia gladiata TaxID=3824 RepID=A0AAN9M014_CANGL
MDFPFFECFKSSSLPNRQNFNVLIKTSGPRNCITVYPFYLISNMGQSLFWFTTPESTWFTHAHTIKFPVYNKREMYYN